MRTNTVVSLAFKAIAVLVLVSAPLTADAQEKRRDVLFTQQDTTLEFHLDFDPAPPALIGGHGVEAGTVTGAIQGTSLTNFKFRGLTLDNHVGIADTDGDRIIFRKQGTGFFLPPLLDPSAPADFQVFGVTGSTIVLFGTYEVVATTGKYTKRFQIGDTFPFRSIATNPSFPPATAPSDPFSIVPGTEYVEVFRN